MSYHSKIHRKSFATLLEVLIAMVLTSMILTTLSFFYQQIDAMNRESERLQRDSFLRRFLQYRLTQILPKSFSSIGSNRSAYYFFNTSFAEGLFKPGTQSLVFGFDNCVDLDSMFASAVLGRLYVDREGRLCLGIWPTPNRWEDDETPPMKQEVLFENVAMLKFQFFIPPDKGTLKDVKEQPTSPEDVRANITPIPPGAWVDTWLQEYDQLPAIVRLFITQEGQKDPLVYSFPLPNSKNPIIYDH
ncbi:putative uncharacterized protein [Parachlamydia acanthamoebae UV-7]|jgi:type II secretory pathway pseudopilin PulG|uniref:Type II secretion system protein J n=2 Tax=Parachlamydia acanthamoebae TaxID=83552 RepID=F8KXN1_PARAV|nr:hypothetical protein [Parachlamydia acanthamoebae]KIA76797.1 hypothetical protein DB43_HJ00080 [Parachlamydia acanthamoebae]CCB87511.1 putative uncharacterized protein [Parachlamydia acanthamoebae UV-7]